MKWMLETKKKWGKKKTHKKTLFSKPTKKTKMEGKQCLQHLHTLRAQIKEKRVEISGLAQQEKRLQSQAIQGLLSINKRFMSISDNGGPPYCILSKHQTDGSLTRERAPDFFAEVIERVQSNPNPLTVGECVVMMSQFLQEFSKRDLIIRVGMIPPRKTTTEDLQLWLNGQMQ